MTERSWKIFRILALLVGIITIFIDWRMTTGWLLGCGEAYLQYYRTDKFWNNVIDSGHAVKRTGYFHFLISYAIMGLTLLVCALLPQILNIYLCALGMMSVKLTSILEITIYREK